jgi:hypothetical protein
MHLLEFNNPKQDIVGFVQKHCSKILEVYRTTGKRLLRGIRSDAKIILEKSPTNRYPKDTNSKVSAMLDEALLKEGFTAIRSNSIFCVSDLWEAAHYGDHVYDIFPIDGFSYSWCATADDLTSKFHLDSIYWTYEGDEDNPHNQFVSDLMHMPSKEFLDTYRFKDNIDIDHAIEAEHEVLIHGRYVAILNRETQLLYDITGKA